MGWSRIATLATVVVLSVAAGCTADGSASRDTAGTTAGQPSDRPASDGPASDGPASDGPASDGPAFDGSTMRFGDLPPGWVADVVVPRPGDEALGEGWQLVARNPDGPPRQLRVEVTVGPGAVRAFEHSLMAMDRPPEVFVVGDRELVLTGWSSHDQYIYMWAPRPNHLVSIWTDQLSEAEIGAVVAAVEPFDDVFPPLEPVSPAPIDPGGGNVPAQFLDGWAPVLTGTGDGGVGFIPATFFWDSRSGEIVEVVDADRRRLGWYGADGIGFVDVATLADPDWDWRGHLRSAFPRSGGYADGLIRNIEDNGGLAEPVTVDEWLARG